MTRYRQPSQSYPPRREREQPALPAHYLESGYLDKRENVLPEVIQDWPKQIAQTFRRGGLSSTQLRRFFNKVRAIEGKWKAKPEKGNWDRLKEEILALKPLAAVAVGKRNAPDIFNTFMELNVGQAVKSPDAFLRGFVIHFQSIVAYTKYFEETRRG